MKCPRCGKENPAEVHTCTPLPLRLADSLDSNPSDITGHKAAAELRRLYKITERDTALLRQALEALVFYGAAYGTSTSEDVIITALRERLGEKA